jgi:hypothetical protein
MNKIRAVQWIGLIPFAILIILEIILFIITGFSSKIFYVLSLTIILLIYVLTYLFFDKLFKYGEKNLSNDKEILILEKEECSLWWMYLSGAGFTFLVAGLPIFNENPLFAITGLIFLVIGNLVYDIFYYPKYRLLFRKREDELEAEAKKGKIKLRKK